MKPRSHLIQLTKAAATAKPRQGRYAEESLEFKFATWKREREIALAVGKEATCNIYADCVSANRLQRIPYILLLAN